MLAIALIGTAAAATASNPNLLGWITAISTVFAIIAALAIAVGSSLSAGKLQRAEWKQRTKEIEDQKAVFQETAVSMLRGEVILITMQARDVLNNLESLTALRFRRPVLDSLLPRLVELPRYAIDAISIYDDDLHRKAKELVSAIRDDKAATNLITEEFFAVCLGYICELEDGLVEHPRPTKQIIKDLEIGAFLPIEGHQ